MIREGGNLVIVVPGDALDRAILPWAATAQLLIARRSAQSHNPEVPTLKPKR